MKLQFRLLKKCFILSFLLASVVMANAQEQRTSSETSLTPKFGIKAGVNLANLYVDDVKDENMKLGFNGGLVAKIPLVKGLSIQPELLYTSKGSKLTYDNVLFGSGEYRYNLNYVELPLLAVINLGKCFNIQAGGYAAYLTGANIKNMDNEGNVNDITKLNAE